MAQAWCEMSKQLSKAFSVAWQTGRKEAGDCCPLRPRNNTSLGLSGSISHGGLSHFRSQHAPKARTSP